MVGKASPAATEPDGCLPTLRAGSGEKRVQSDLQTDSCHTKSKLLGSAIEDVRPSPSASSPLPYTLVAHRRVHVLAHCSLKCYQNCPFVRTLPLLPDPPKTPNPLGRRLRASWAKSVALSPVCRCGSCNCMGQVLNAALLPAFPESGEQEGP